MKQIPVGKTYLALVDDEDYEDLIKFRWNPHNPSGRTFYAIRRWLDGKIQRSEYMHKRITGYSMTDHINQDGLDNRKSNLREATSRQNNSNVPKRLGNYTSSYKGVWMNKDRTKWISQITYEGKAYHLGTFLNETDAAEAYNMAALKYFGEFAYINNLEA